MAASLKMQSKIMRLWLYPSVVECSTKSRCVHLIREISFALVGERLKADMFLVNRSTIDMSLLRFFVTCQLLSDDSTPVPYRGLRIGLFCIEVEGLERPYQVLFSSQDDILVDFIIRGATTDQLIATGQLSLEDTSCNYNLLGSSTWHAVLAKLLDDNRQILRNEFKDALRKNKEKMYRLNICIDTYSNIGHALQNEIGPLLLANKKLNIKYGLVARKVGPYNLKQFIDYSDTRIDHLNAVDQIYAASSGIYIYRNCLIPTGSNPRLGIYASYKLSGSHDSQIGRRARYLRRNLLQYDEVIYVSPRIDHKRGVCINQDLLITSFIHNIAAKAITCDRKVVILLEKLWFANNSHTRDHNKFVDDIISSHKNLYQSSITFLSLPRLHLHEKLYALRAASAFIGAGGANFCTFFDWQGCEVPALIYGDYNLMIKGRYFDEYLHSRFTYNKIAGRYVLFGDSIGPNEQSSNYSISDLQITFGVRSLATFIMKKYEDRQFRHTQTSSSK